MAIVSPEAKARKASKRKAYNALAKNVAKRVELNRERRRRKAKGQNLSGKELDHVDGVYGRKKPKLKAISAKLNASKGGRKVAAKLGKAHMKTIGARGGSRKKLRSTTT